ncbi:DUF6602 domain-containing protein [Gimesia aquarii]|uniref:Alpha/beta hydrolase family protein n=1 Tax=Gimesia aquarii TaxID=2527964 RepID=A0A517VQG5_9PLAN|nr:DUF6602 domain-containing protein [Gimesia aquarii]QDT95265.1 Alpha/beta hydrolase family protein [Gimesia aquarii]
MQQQEPESQPEPVDNVKAKADHGLGAGLFDFYASQAEVMLAQYENIVHLLGPTDDWTAPGTHCEVLLRDFLRRNLPSTFSVDKGFIYGRREVKGASKHCPEIDILIHDTSYYRPAFRLEDFVIVQPEAVRGIIQVKRTLTSKQLKSAIENVVEAKRFVRECATQMSVPLDKVFSAAVFFEDNIPEPVNKTISETYENQIVPHFSEFKDGNTMPNYVGSLKHNSLFFSGLNRQRMSYGIYHSVHNGKNAGLQGMLVSLSRTILPHGMQPRFQFPDDYQNFEHFVFYERMKVLFIHDLESSGGGVKPTFLNKAGHDVITPALDDDFDLAVRTAQTVYDQHEPDVIVGSSRGGAVAMNINAGKTPMVLLCPAWKKWGTATTIKSNSVILHSKQDDVVPFEDSEELVSNSNLPSEVLIEVGTDHRLADPEPLKAMLEACEQLRGECRNG